MKTKITLFMILLPFAILFSGCQNSSAGTDTTPSFAIVYDFESDLESWSYEYPLEADDISQSTEQAYTGSGSMKVTCEFTGTTNQKATIRRSFSSDPQDLADDPVYISLFVPAALSAISDEYKISMIVQRPDSGGVFGWSSVNGSDIEGQGWQTISFTGGSDWSGCTTICFQLSKKDYANSTNWVGDIYFDYIRW